jgi:hypothetical protein
MVNKRLVDLITVKRILEKSRKANATINTGRTNPKDMSLGERQTLPKGI